MLKSYTGQTITFIRQTSPYFVETKCMCVWLLQVQRVGRETQERLEPLDHRTLFTMSQLLFVRDPEVMFTHLNLNCLTVTSLCLTICYIINFLLFVIWIQTHLVPVFLSFCGLRGCMLVLFVQPLHPVGLHCTINQSSSSSSSSLWCYHLRW